MPDRILVVNAGSSSLKLSVVGAPDAAGDGMTLDSPEDIGAAIRDFRQRSGSIDAAGVRVVHGGDLFRESVLMTPDVLERLCTVSDLAPLHNPPAIAALRALVDAGSDVPVIACFDTAFHASLPPAAATYAIPQQWRHDWPLHRFGFHGLSHAYAARRASQLLGREGDAGLRLVTCHLGAGASLAAVVGGISCDTTMGFTPLDGLVMATRPGALDPGVILWLCRHTNMTPSAIESALEHDSGLVALAGSTDMRKVLARAADGDERCVLARDVYVHRLCGLIAAMVATMEGVDGIVFTGGVGEGSAEIRRRVCARMGYLGVAIDAIANDSWSGRDGTIASTRSAMSVLVVTAREDLEIAREVLAVLARGSA